MERSTKFLMRPRGASSRGSKPGFRSDIQGIRAMAVVLVIANHLIHRPSGGYVGVDVFFVVSGFVISTGLIREQRDSGWVSIPSFYGRRLRRIMPVAVAVAAVTILASFIVWLPARSSQTVVDGISAMFWVSNWHFAALGTDYLAASGPVSPFQHYWSLSVEEQFYLAMPWLVIALGLVTAKLRRISFNTVMLAGLTVFAITSFAWSAFLTQRNPSIAYFDTIGRSWEFFAGALIAVVGPSLASCSRVVGLAMRATGLAAIIGTAWLFTADTVFPAPFALLPVLGTVLIIAAGFVPQLSETGVLNTGVAQYLGKISYSLYLWHFPVIIYLGVVIPDDLIWQAIVSVLVMLGLSHLSYKFIEEPCRHSKWLRSWEVRRTSASKRWRRRQLLGGMAAALVVAALAGVQMVGPDWARSATALRPSLSPAMDQCRNSVSTVSPQFCYYGDQASAEEMLVLGDSVAVSWIPTVAAAFPERRTVGVGFASCSPFEIVTLPRNMTSSFVAECDGAKESMYKIAADEEPEVVVLSSDLGGYLRQSDGAIGEIAAQNWQLGVEKTAARYKALGASVVILSSPPLGGDIQACSSRIAKYDRCSTSLTREWKTKAEAEAKAARNSGVAFIDVRDWFCSSDGACPALISGVVARSDATHITEEMAVLLGPKLAASGLF